MNDRSLPDLSADAMVRQPPLVFFSYSRAQMRLVQAIALEVRLSGLGTWLDVENLTPGETWQTAIEGALVRADIFVACICRRSVESAWTSIELESAVRSGIAILPVLLEEVSIETLPPALARRQAIDASRVDPSERPGQIAQEIAKALGITTPFVARNTEAPTVILLGEDASNAGQTAHYARRVVNFDRLDSGRLVDLLDGISSGEAVALVVGPNADLLQAAALLGVLSGLTRSLTLLELRPQGADLASIATLLEIPYRNSREL